VTESEWLACNDPRPMLKFLPARGNERKLRLFAVACVRRIWDLFSFGEDERIAMELVERCADGLTERGDFDAYMNALETDKSEVEEVPKDEVTAIDLEMTLAGGEAGEALVRALGTAFHLRHRVPVTAPSKIQKAAAGAARKAARAVSTFRAGWLSAEPDWSTVFEAERREQSRLFRDIFGNPFRLISVDPIWFGWNDGTVVKLAQAIYEDRAFERLPVLADALEDAGCSDAIILAHCRGPGPHVRGCWVIDLLVGKEQGND
jgi:hypothetical protein